MSQPVKKKTLTSKLSDEPEDTSTIVEPTKRDSQSDEHIGIDVEIAQAKSATVDSKETSESAQTPDSESEPSLNSSISKSKDASTRSQTFEFSRQHVVLSRDRIVEPTKPDAGFTIDKPTETEVAPTSVKPTQPINPSTNAKTTDPDLLLIDASTNAQTTEPNPLRQSSYVPSSDLNMFSTLGIPSEMVGQHVALSRDRIVEPTKPDAGFTIDKHTETEAEEKRLKIEATKAKAMAIAEKNQIAASTSVKPTQPINASTNAKTTDPDLSSVIDASTNAQTTEPNPLRQSSYEYTVEIPNKLYEPNSSDLKMFSTLGIPSEMYKKKSPNVDFLEPLSSIMFDTYGLEQNASRQSKYGLEQNASRQKGESNMLSWNIQEYDPYLFTYGHGSEFDFEKLKKEYESHLLPKKVETYELLKYDHYVAYRNRIIENMWFDSINDVCHKAENIKIYMKKVEEDKIMAKNCARYTNAIRIIHAVIKIRKHYPDKEFDAPLKQKFIIAVKARQELVEQIPQETRNMLMKKEKEAVYMTSSGLPTIQDVVEHMRLQQATMVLKEEPQLIPKKVLKKKFTNWKTIIKKGEPIKHGKPSRNF